MKSLLCVLFLSVIMIACSEKSPDCGDPGSSNCELVLKDAQNNLLVGTIYNQDSIRMQVGNQQIPLHFDNGIIIFNFAGFDSLNSSDYILKLNNENFDTLNLKIRKYVNPCWTSYLLDSLSYNNQVLDKITMNRYEIVK